MICTRCLVHSLAMVEAMCVLLVAVSKVAILEFDNVIVTASEVFDVIIAPELEGVDGKVKVLPVVVTGCCFLQRGRNKAAGTRRG